MHSNLEFEKKIDNFVCCSFLSVAFKATSKRNSSEKRKNCVFCSSFFFLANLLFVQSHRPSINLHMNVKETYTFHVKWNKLAMSECRDRSRLVVVMLAAHRDGPMSMRNLMGDSTCKWWQIYHYVCHFCLTTTISQSIFHTHIFLKARQVFFFHDLCYIWEI